LPACGLVSRCLTQEHEVVKPSPKKSRWIALVLLVSCKDARSENAEAGEASPPAAPVSSEPVSSEIDRPLDRGGLPEGWREPHDAAEHEALLRTQKATKALVTALMQRLTSVLGEAGGMIAAVRVCASEAQDLTAGVAEAQGMALGRSSTRLRNPENRPPQWVAQWLADHEGQAADTVEPMLGIAVRDGKRVARYVGPIGVQPLCLSCHGPPETIPAEVKAILAQQYPRDKATGYAVGDLRGAVWAELELEAETR
jgi:hypothetical protein